MDAGFVGQESQSGKRLKPDPDFDRAADHAKSVASDQLRAFVERIERLEEERKVIADDVKDVYAEAKGTGFDVKVLRKVIALRKRDASERQEEEAILDLYMHALGMDGPGD